MIESIQYVYESAYFKLFVCIWIGTILFVFLYPGSQINRKEDNKLRYKINPKTIWVLALFPEFVALLLLILPLTVP